MPLGLEILLLLEKSGVTPPTPPTPEAVSLSGGPFWQPWLPLPWIEPLDVWYAAIENLTAEGDANSINIPWLLAISVSVGNAATQSIGKNAVVWVDPEWGEVTGAGKGSLYGNGGIGSGEGGLYVSW